MAKLQVMFNANLTAAGKKTRFAKGEQAWNKGKQQSDYMSEANIQKTASTRFKKGQDPHNTVRIGAVRLTKDGYYEIKVRHLKIGGTNKNFEAVHRIIYEKAVGPIPPGCKVVFVDGNPKNLAIDNLRLRTLAESLQDNRLSDTAILKRQLRIRSIDEIQFFRAQLPDLIQVYRNILVTKQKINERSRKNNGQA